MVIDDLIEIAEKERAGRKKYVVRCCMAAGCMSSDSKGVKEALDKAVKEAGLEDQVEVRGVGCMKLCCQGPLVQVDAHAEGATVEVTQKAGVDGRLFGSVTNVDVVEALKALGFTVEKSAIRMSAGPLKQVGDHPLVVVLHADVTASITVRVIGETVAGS